MLFFMRSFSGAAQDSRQGRWEGNELSPAGRPRPPGLAGQGLLGLEPGLRLSVLRGHARGGMLPSSPLPCRHESGWAHKAEEARASVGTQQEGAELDTWPRAGSGHR